MKQDYPELIILAYLGAYGAHMFALRVWVGHGASKTFFLYTLQMILLGLT